jgi:iron complex outermembrane recepter protein
VDIDQEINSYQAVGSAANADVSSLFGNWIYQNTNNSHSKVLPSANLKLNMGERMVLRFAGSQTMTMPDFSALGASSWGSDLNRTGGGGNPNLKPVVSTNLDTNFEWYFAEHGLVSVGAFWMDLNDYVAFGTENRQLFSELTNQLETYLVSVPINSNGKVKGLELAYEQPIGDSFGVNANYTYSDGETDHTWADGSHNLVGTSKDTYNVGAYFENKMFSARANYSYRTSFLIGLSGANPYYQDDFGTLSLTLSYKPNDWLSFNLDALNLNDPELKYFQSASAPTAFYVNGRQFYLNARMKF